MKAVRFVHGGAIVVAWIGLGLSAYAIAGGSPAPGSVELGPGRAEWHQRVLQRSAPRPGPGGGGPEVEPSRVARQWSPYRPSEPMVASRMHRAEPGLAADAPVSPSASPEVIPTPEAVPSEVMPQRGAAIGPAVAETWEAGCSPDSCGACDGDCATCWDECAMCEGACGPYSGYYRGCVVDWLRNFSFFAGIHGFKGPLDVGQNGNFGFHEGLNYGGPLGDPWGIGYQLGFQAVHSDLAGFQIDADQQVGQLDVSGRDQLFFTAGLFKRAECGGLQGGVVFDYVHDSYYDKADLRQIRSETSIVFRDGLSELGYWGAYGVNRQRFQIVRGDPDSFVLFRPNDIFAMFYRRHFTGGGQGRIWAGATGFGQAIVGGEATVPLGTNWALENNFVYVIPKNASVEGGQREETWSVSIGLVWYPGRPARCVFQDPFHPLFGVADNSAFLVARHSEGD